MVFVFEIYVYRLSHFFPLDFGQIARHNMSDVEGGLLKCVLHLAACSDKVRARWTKCVGSIQHRV